MEEEKKDILEETEEEKKEEEKEEKPEEEKKEEDSKIVKAFTDTKDDTGEFDKKDIEDNSVMGLLAYIWILWLIPLLAAKNSKFAKFHANQGLILFILEVIGGAVFGPFIAIFADVPFFALMASAVSCKTAFKLFALLAITKLLNKYRW